MIRLLALCAIILAFAPAWASAQPTTQAEIIASKSSVATNWHGSVQVTLGLSRGVPFRVFTLDAPPRLVVDLEDSRWTGAPPEKLADQDENILDMRFGTFQPGWSRLVADLAGPMLPVRVGVQGNNTDGEPVLSIVLETTNAEEFAARSGAPVGALLANATPKVLPSVAADRFVVVIDPGHGGIDPGAERDGHSEKQLMLEIALALRDRLLGHRGVDVVLTRDTDVFVSLAGRVAIAHQVDADLFVSLHADALPEGGAQGATIYTLSVQASDRASQDLATRHNRSDILAGLDLGGSDDEVTGVLLDLVRHETEPRSQALATELAKALSEAGGPMNSRPLRKAGFSVLKSADIPSALVEVGFLSSTRDLENILNPAWRSTIVNALALGIIEWQAKDDVRQAQVRQ